LIPLDVEPPREIPEEERLLRDRKDKQLKMRELVTWLFVINLGTKGVKRERGKGKTKDEEQIRCIC
jgi:hypothetical protein